MSHWIKHHLGFTWLVALLAVGAVITAVAANASSSAGSSPQRPSASGHASAVLAVNLSSGGFTIPGPSTRPAGPVTLRVTTTAEAGNYFYTFRLRGDTTIPQVAQWSGEVNSHNKTIEHNAALSLYKWVDYTGGVAVYPDTPATLTINLRPGTYYFYSTEAFNDTDDSAYLSGVRHPGIETMAAMSTSSQLNTLQVTAASGHAPTARKPRIDGVINLVMRDGQPVFEIPASLPGDGTFLVRNDINQPAEAIFRKVAPGMTDPELQKYFDGLLAGEKDQSSPLTSSPGGILTISPGNSAIVHLDFPAATYAVLSFLEDPTTNVHRAYEGLHKIIVMH
jgi:hypothetical protein